MSRRESHWPDCPMEPRRPIPLIVSRGKTQSLEFSEIKPSQAAQLRAAFFAGLNVSVVSVTRRGLIMSGLSRALETGYQVPNPGSPYIAIESTDILVKIILGETVEFWKMISAIPLPPL